METSPSATSPPDALERACSPRLRELQRAARAPSVVAAVVRDGAIAWSGAAGLADVEREPGLDTQYRIGSITKTFTAVLLLQLRDAGRLDLDDRLDQHLPGTRHGDATLRRMLAHLSGLQREAVAQAGGEVWETLEDPDRETLLATFEQASKVLPPGRRWHYSNLAYALLGEVVARSAGTTWEAALSERLLGPLRLRRTTLDPVEPSAKGYLVDPYADAVRPEPLVTLRGTAPAAQLWSTASDLATWAAFPAEPDPALLSPDSLAEMRHAQVITDPDGWTLAWGLGLMLYRRGERLLHGHAGAMPGFLASMAVLAKDRERAGAVVMANTSAGADVEGLAVDLLTAVLEEDPREPAAWRPGEPPPPEVLGLLGRWWSEGSEYVFRWRDGHLEASAVAQRRLRPRAAAVFEPIGRDRWTTVSGREEGETLRAVRAARARWPHTCSSHTPPTEGANRRGQPTRRCHPDGATRRAHPTVPTPAKLRGMSMRMGTLDVIPAMERLDLLGTPVAAAFATWNGPVPVSEIGVAEIDPELADTAAFCERYEVGPEESANCVVVAARRGGETRLAACVVLATTRADVNGLVRRHLGARRASFAPMDTAVAETGMEFGGITPIGLPDGWPILIDAAVAAVPWAVVGSGVRRSKLILPGKALADLPASVVLDGLAR